MHSELLQKVEISPLALMLKEADGVDRPVRTILDTLEKVDSEEDGNVTTTR
jgi:hypothetical protein